MTKEGNSPTQGWIGAKLVGGLIALGKPKAPTLLLTLLSGVGLSKADMSSWTGVTLSRIGHYVNYGSPVPKGRNEQFYSCAYCVWEKLDEHVKAFKERPDEFPLGPLRAEIIALLEAKRDLCAAALRHHDKTVADGTAQIDRTHG